MLVDVVTAREELSMPPAITAAQMEGFTVWALKTVLSGRVELIDLADTERLAPTASWKPGVTAPVDRRFLARSVVRFSGRASIAV
ncbi:MAG: hypothetical protein R2692_06780 [Microbacterium sp.]